VAAVGLLYVGAVLFVNGLALTGFVKGKSLIPINLFVGLLQVITPLYLIFTAHGNQATIVGASGLFLFGFTYLYVCMTNAWDWDPTGVGWFSLFVVFAAVVYCVWNFTHSGFLGVPVAAAGGDNAVGNLLGVLWATWAVLWFFFWLVLGLGKTGLTRFTGAWTAAQGIYTGFIPALVLLNVPSALTNTFAVIIGVISVGTFLIFLVLMKPRWSEAPVEQAPAPSATAYSGA
jgi:putative amide transporter protein